MLRHAEAHNRTFKPVLAFRCDQTSTRHRLHHGQCSARSTNEKGVPIGLDAETFVAALIQVSGAGGVIVGVVALGVGVGHPLGELGDLVIGRRPQNEVPVVGHEAEGEDADGDILVGFVEDAFEGGVVLIFMEDSLAGDTTSDDVEDHFRRGCDVVRGAWGETKLGWGAGQSGN